MSIKKLIIYIAIPLALTSCANTYKLTDMPSDPDDFNTTVKSLKEKYPEIKKYDGSKEFEFFQIPELPKLEQVTELWGKPNKSETDWNIYALNNVVIFGMAASEMLSYTSSGLIFLTFIKPNQTHVWNKNNIRIKAYTMSPATLGYEPHIFNWEWTEIKNNSYTEPQEPVQKSEAQQDILNPDNDPFFNFNFGISPFLGLIGIEYQSNNNAIGVGLPGHISYRYFFHPYRDSKFIGTYVGRYSTDNTDDTVDVYLL